MGAWSPLLQGFRRCLIVCHFLERELTLIASSSISMVEGMGKHNSCGWHTRLNSYLECRNGQNRMPCPRRTSRTLFRRNGKFGPFERRGWGSNKYLPILLSIFTLAAILPTGLKLESDRYLVVQRENLLVSCVCKAWHQMTKIGRGIQGCELDTVAAS